MKRLMMAVAVLAAFGASADGLDFTGFKRLGKGTDSFNHVLDPDFDDMTFRKPDGKSKAWAISDEAHIDARYGFNQRGLGIVRPPSETNKYTLSMQFVKTLKPNTSYEFGCRVKVENSDERTSACLGLEGGLIGPIYKAWNGNFDWTPCTFEFSTKEKQEPVAVVLFLRKGRCCTAMYDNFYIREVGGSYVVGLLNPFLRIDGKDRRLLFGANAVGRIVYEGCDKAVRVARVVVKDAAGKVVLTKDVPVARTRFAVDAASLADGVYTYDVTLVDTANRIILTEEKAQRLQVGAPSVPKPARGVTTIDKYGRTLVDGKPFLPLAVYVGGIGYYQTDWFKGTDFNTFLAYSGFWSKVDGRKNGKEALRECLDHLDKEGFKIILGSKAFCPKFDEGVDKLMAEWGAKKGEVDYETFLAGCAETIKDHPALLGYYTTDELPPERYHELLTRRETFLRVDPWHLTTGVFFRLGEMASYTGVTDAPSIDFYPIGGKDKPQSQKLVTESMDKANEVWARPDTGAMPFWATLQMFSWGGSDPDKNKNYRMPTERESIAMAFMSAIGGAKGFIWYYLFDIAYGCGGGATGREKFVRFEANWRIYREVAHELKLLEPFILSTTKGPKVTVTDVKGTTRARAFVDDEFGRIRVLIACEGPGESEAEIEVEGEAGLSCKFGNVKAEQKDGKTIYRFKGTGVDCDLMERWPENEFKKKLQK